ncbi:MAG: 4Fe-4S ferredoxin [Bacteroidetes bacterium]|nr:MAG: 4Fe-4S ferredoxin [Bacteroidota bacterium]
MKRIKQYIDQANLSRFRTYFQILAFVVIVYGGYLGINIGDKTPAFACPYSPGSSGTCYLVAVQHGLHLEWSSLFGFRGLALLTGLGTFVLFFVVFNKAWCGFVCPFGTLQDWITKLRKFFGFRFSRYDEASFKKLKIIKYVFLVLLILIPLAMSNSFFGLPKVSDDMSAPFCQICPGRTIAPLLVGDTSEIFVDFTNKTTMVMSVLGLIFTALFFVGSFFKKRFFCFFCPMSALQYMFSKVGVLRLTKNGDNCTRCGNCSRVCDMGIASIADDIVSTNAVVDDCMMCFKCVEACPEPDCLDVKVFKGNIFSSTSEGFFKRYGESELADQSKK